jgi:hypothetical protein
LGGCAAGRHLRRGRAAALRRKVGTGFSDEQRRTLAGALGTIRSAGSPFAGSDAAGNVHVVWSTNTMGFATVGDPDTSGSTIDDVYDYTPASGGVYTRLNVGLASSPTTPGRSRTAARRTRS